MPRASDRTIAQGTSCDELAPSQIRRRRMAASVLRVPDVRQPRATKQDAPGARQGRCRVRQTERPAHGPLAAHLFVNVTMNISNPSTHSLGSLSSCPQAHGPHRT